MTAYAAAIALLCLLVLEVSMGAGFFTPTFDLLGLKVVLDRDVLYRIKPFGRGDINSMGYRDREFHKAEEGKKRILFVGDSFVMGTNIRSDETVPKVLEALLGPGHEVFNMGIQGYGPDQSLIRLLEDGPALDPDMVVLGLYPSNDFNDLYKNRLFRPDGRGGLATVSPNAVTAVMPRSDVLYLYDYLLFKYGIMPGYFRDLFITLFRDKYDRDLYLHPESPPSKAKLDLMRAVLRRFKEELSDRGVDFMVVIIPYPKPFVDEQLRASIATGPSRYFSLEVSAKVLCDSESIPSINLYPAFLADKGEPPLYSGEDLHFSPRGSKVAAEIIRGRLAPGGAARR